jgi:predicted glycoside hydrolase/deacetylase ChbG (UPF0249 family)
MLRSLAPSVAVGLHLVLAGETPITAMPMLAPSGRLPGIDQLTVQAIVRRLPLPEIAREVAAQFDSFTSMMGRPPAFVDGHQHSHVLPGIRGIVIAATKRQAPGAWIRDCTDRFGAIMARPFRGKALASAVHSIGLAKAAGAAGIPCNVGFAGHYDFNGDYGAIFPRFLRSPGPIHLVMCHPGTGDLAGDTIAAARVREAAALRTMQIRDMAAQHGLTFDT